MKIRRKDGGAVRVVGSYTRDETIGARIDGVFTTRQRMQHT